MKYPCSTLRTDQTSFCRIKPAASGPNPDKPESWLCRFVYSAARFEMTLARALINQLTHLSLSNIIDAPTMDILEGLMPEKPTIYEPIPSSPELEKQPRHHYYEEEELEEEEEAPLLSLRHFILDPTAWYRLVACFCISLLGVAFMRFCGVQSPGPEVSSKRAYTSEVR